MDEKTFKSFGDYIEEQGLNEEFHIRVHSNATKTKKLVCPHGYQPNEEGSSCVPISSEQKLHMKQGAREAKITKKAEGEGLKKKTLKKRKKALKFRKMMGVTH